MNENNNWCSGEDMNMWLKERYFDICYSQYRAVRGECFGFAGISLLTGTSGAILSSEYRWLFIAFFACLTAVFLISAHRIRRTAEKDLMFIPQGRFQWQYDSVKTLLPDRYPDTCKVVAEKSGETCVIMQGFWFFKEEGTGIYLVKPDSDVEFSAMSRFFCQNSKKVQAFIA